MQVTIYTLNNCSASKQAKELLHECGVNFKEKNCDDRSCYRQLIAKHGSYGGMPVTIIDDYENVQIIRGFKPKLLKVALK